MKDGIGEEKSKARKGRKKMRQEEGKEEKMGKEIRQEG